MSVIVKGGYQTRFGELWKKSLRDLIVEAGEGAIKNAGIKKKDIDLVIVGNKLESNMSGQKHLGILASEWLNLEAAGIRIEGACASGGLAVHQAVQAIKSSEVKTVLVIGAEKMTDKSNGVVAQALMGAGSEKERKIGLSFVGLYALIARAYMKKYGLKKKDLARIAVWNHKNAVLNPKAQYRKEISIEIAMKTTIVADPLKLFDCSPISDGAAGVVISKGEKGVNILASEIARDSLGLNDRKSLTELVATQKASNRAYEKAGINVKDINIAEIHDCFTINQIIGMEDLGFCKKGNGYKKAKIPINISGGLKACGHPVGATGVRQVVEIYKQLSGQAGKRQIKDVKVGLTHNVGGTGGTVVVHILKNIL